MAQQQPNESLTSDEPVTDTRVAAGGTAPTDAENRDCEWCGGPISSDEVLVMVWAGLEPAHEACAASVLRDRDRGRYERFHKKDKEDPDWVAAINPDALGYDPFGDQIWTLRPCEVCGRQLRGQGRIHAVCSEECRDELPPVAARKRRRQVRESQIPESFTCSSCEKVIEGTVVFWWNGSWGRDRAHDVTWCESCWAAMRTEEERERFADYERQKDDPGQLGSIVRAFGPPGNPDVEGYDPFAQVGGFEPKPCGHCGRSIRWGDPNGYCCPRCKYEDTKARRRVQPKSKKCAVCGRTFTPERKDGKTCSDKCRKTLSRSRKPKKRVTAVRDQRRGPAARDTAKRDKPRVTPAKGSAGTRGTRSKAVRSAPVKPASDTTPNRRKGPR